MSTERRAFVLAVASGNVSALAALRKMTDDQLQEAESWARGEALERFDAGKASLTLPDYPQRVIRGADAFHREWASRGETVRQARDRLEREMRAGVDCSCCGRLVQLYRRKFSALMAGTIVWLVRQSEATRTVPRTDPTSATSPGNARAHGWVCWAKDAPPTIHRMHEISRVVQFGLAEPGRWRGGSGWYRPTPLGFDFVLHGANIPAAIETYNDTVVTVDKERVTVHETLPGFNLDDLMKAGLKDSAAWDLRRKRGILADEAT